MKTPVSPVRGESSRPSGSLGISRLAEDITAQVIAALREGVRPWQQPWDSGAVAPGEDGRPLRHTGEAYGGINVLLLWLISQERGYLSPIWMTYRQARAYRGQVRRGERGTTVVYADRFVKTVEDAESGEAAERLIPFLKTYAVFNSEQIDGLPERFRPSRDLGMTPAREAERVAAVEAFFVSCGAVIRHHGDCPCYSPLADEIRLPAPGAFRSLQAYYATLAHELIHWTRHPSRLDRDFGRKAWGDAGYAMEELVALS